ncbi:phosphatase PAP2 family protein [Luteimicrobium subarcticum]|uniref:Undecaprenyl-diphosphatase n=1 Tax=Luteimicrobium subarcticum TaxID=620910 RepID=A0A2M8W6S2_9MICO|nr:phosphatase PAP2 family protein [Luteimicrobium subarcticum]PJI86630.1 undecaprenyl-diphosphatase [Luteimicrobium subarcticum]
MNRFVHRYEIDQSRPPVKAALRDVAVRALAPAVVWWVLVAATGLVIVHVFDQLRGEDAVDRWFVQQRTASLTAVSGFFSMVGSTGYAIGVCVVVCLVLLWRTRQWWFSLVPALALSLQALVFVTSATLVGRTRPDVEKLDVSPPTSSFPSGHTSASTALYVTLALVFQRIQHTVLRRTLTVLVLLVPLCVATARLYRGMHAPTDVTVGLLNGSVCAVLAWRYLRRDVRESTSDGTPETAGARRTTDPQVTASAAPAPVRSPSA